MVRKGTIVEVPRLSDTVSDTFYEGYDPCSGAPDYIACIEEQPPCIRRCYQHADVHEFLECVADCKTSLGR